MAEFNEVEFHLTERPIRWLAAAIRNQQMKVSKHQRHAGVWTMDVKKKFVDSMKRGHPCPLILIYQDDDGDFWLEDGLQRMTTISSFMNDDFGELTTEQKFSEWSELHRQLFQHKKIPVLIYSNADQKTRVEIFDRFQNGSPLKAGERLNSLGDTELVRVTRMLLLADVDENGAIVYGEYYNRLCDLVGYLRIGADDKRYTQLLDMCAVMNGIAHGFVDGNKGISKKYMDLRSKITEPIDLPAARRVIEELLWIFEEARRRYPTDDRNKLMVYRNPGIFIGPIVYSLKMFPGDWARLQARWIDVIVQFAQTPTKQAMRAFLQDPLTGLLRGVSKDRSWNNDRWQFIYENAFNLPHLREAVPVDDGVDTDDTE